MNEEENAAIACGLISIGLFLNVVIWGGYLLPSNGLYQSFVDGGLGPFRNIGFSIFIFILWFIFGLVALLKGKRIGDGLGFFSIFVLPAIIGTILAIFSYPHLVGVIGIVFFIIIAVFVSLLFLFEGLPRFLTKPTYVLILALSAAIPSIMIATILFLQFGTDILTIILIVIISILVIVFLNNLILSDHAEPSADGSAESIGDEFARILTKFLVKLVFRAVLISPILMYIEGVQFGLKDDFFCFSILFVVSGIVGMVLCIIFDFFFVLLTIEFLDEYHIWDDPALEVIIITVCLVLSVIIELAIRGTNGVVIGSLAGVVLGLSIDIIYKYRFK